MKGEDYFNSIDTLEPKCPKCGVKVKYGENTEYSEELECHICLECGEILR